MLTLGSLRGRSVSACACVHACVRARACVCGGGGYDKTPQRKAL